MGCLLPCAAEGAWGYRFELVEEINELCASHQPNISMPNRNTPEAASRNNNTCSLANPSPIPINSEAEVPRA